MLRLMHVHAHPDDESSKGAASTVKYVARRRRRPRRHLHRWRARLHPEPEDGPSRRAREHHRDPPPGDGRRARDPRRTPGLAGLRRLRVARGRPQAAAARGLLRAGGPAGRRRAAGPADPQLPAARAHDVRRERRLPAPRPHHVPQRLDGRPRGSRRPGALPRRGGAVAGAEGLLPARLQPAADAGAPRGDARRGHRVAVHRADRGVEARPGPRRPDHHPGPVRGLLRGARPCPDRARDPDRPRRVLLPGTAGAAAAGLAHRGVRAGRLQGRDRRCPRTTSSPASAVAPIWRPERLAP